MTTKDNDNLAAVLDRINLLMQATPAVAERINENAEVDIVDEDIPELVEVFTGDPAQLVSRGDRQKKLDAILKEMRPFIHLEVKKAVLQESIKLEKLLTKQVEADLIKNLRERLMS